MTETTTHRRSKKSQLIAAVAVLVFVALISVVLLILTGSSRLNRRLAELKSQGLPTNGEELNAYYSVPNDIVDTTEFWTAATTAVSAAGVDWDVKEIPVVGMGPMPIPPPESEWAELDASRSFLKDLASEQQCIMLAADSGGMARYPIDFTAGYNAILTAQQETRTIARLLTLSAHVHAHDGQGAETLRDVTAIFAVSDSLQGERILVSQLLRIAVHAMGCEVTADMLPHCKWTDTELQNLQIEIGRARFRSEMQTAFHGELALCLDAIDGDPYPQRLFRSANKLKAIELLAESTSGMETSWLEAVKGQQKVDAELNAMSAKTFSRMTYMSVLQILPAIQRTMNAGIKAEARQNSCIATIAAQRYRLQHGTLPQALTDLKDFIPEKDPSKSTRLIDLFDGQPLRFKTKDDGVIIYSIGENRVDDGGDVDNARRVSGDLGYLISK